MLFGLGPKLKSRTPTDGEEPASEGTQTMDRSRRQVLGPNTFQVGVFTKAGKGKQSTQNQDASFVKKAAYKSPTLVGVLDGHGIGGTSISKTVASSLLAVLQARSSAKLSKTDWEEIFAAIDGDLEKRVKPNEGGTTASVAILYNDRSLSIAWVGDSRAIVGGSRGEGVWAKAVTKEHSTDNPAEVRRIVKAGGVLQDSLTGTQRAASTGTKRIGTRQIKNEDKTQTLLRFKADAGVACTRAFGGVGALCI